MFRKLTLTLVAAVSVLSATAATDYAPNNKNRFDGIEKYVGRERSPRYPARFNYTADGKAYLQLSADGKRIVKYDTRTGKELETILSDFPLTVQALRMDFL